MLNLLCSTFVFLINDLVVFENYFINSCDFVFKTSDYNVT